MTRTSSDVLPRQGAGSTLPNAIADEGQLSCFHDSRAISPKSTETHGRVGRAAHLGSRIELALVIGVEGKSDLRAGQHKNWLCPLMVALDGPARVGHEISPCWCGCIELSGLTSSYSPQAQFQVFELTYFNIWTTGVHEGASHRPQAIGSP